ncbi:MAG: hypothetical protein QG597_1094 [Actinomycetota bacterium]|nr:hypothetical protein [Actinomycetota bacterium]
MRSGSSVNACRAKGSCLYSDGVSRPMTRTERRRHSQTRILTAARTLFQSKGYDRTTIRAVAAAAGVDPGLVMQHFGSKKELFRRSLADDPAQAPLADAEADLSPAEHLTAALFEQYGMKLGDIPENTLVLLRSMLTYPEATEKVRRNLAEQATRLTSEMTGDDRELRATLAVITMLGIILGRHVLELDVLTASAPEEIMDAIRPCLEALAEA